MPQIATQYEELNDFTNIAAKLVERYPDIFAAITLDKIACVAITNKEYQEGKKKWEVKTMGPPETIYCQKEYIFVVYQDDWSAMNIKHQNLLVADALLSISPDGDGKTVPFDMKDHSIMLRTFGVDYLDNPEAPDILSQNVAWRN